MYIKKYPNINNLAFSPMSVLSAPCLLKTLYVLNMIAIKEWSPVGVICLELIIGKTSGGKSQY